MIGSQIAAMTLTAGPCRPQARGRSRWFPTRTAAVTLALLATAAAAAQTGPIIGDAFVVDGDTIEIAGKRIQLSGVDAPEDWQFCLDQTGADYQCGKESSLALDAFLSASRPTRCEFSGRDRYGRYVGTCFRADGKDVNRWMVESGYAINRDNPNTGLYAAAQEVARSIGAGMWRGHRRAEPTGAVVEE
ncbi:thermonuclease family protein [Sinorhizobium fredii]|uniref:thermonuclease family protein n=1 Tax=Rhizobium fredii TaxID=380 RepID=UPI0004B9C4E8